MVIRLQIKVSGPTCKEMTLINHLDVVDILQAFEVAKATSGVSFYDSYSSHNKYVVKVTDTTSFIMTILQS